jgi:hypothetical protein
MHQLRVAAVRHLRRRKKRLRVAILQAGRKRRNRVWNGFGGITWRIRSASIRLGEKKSVPSGSRAAGIAASLK